MDDAWPWANGLGAVPPEDPGGGGGGGGACTGGVFGVLRDVLDAF